MKVSFKTSDHYIVSYEDTPELHKKVFDALIREYYQKLEVTIGEVIMQNDDAIIAAPEVLADLADTVIKFDVEEDL